jgi:hypothetical protein
VLGTVQLVFGLIIRKIEFGALSFVSLYQREMGGFFYNVHYQLMMESIVKVPQEEIRPSPISNLTTTNTVAPNANLKINVVTWCICDGYVATSMGDCSIRVRIAVII